MKKYTKLSMLIAVATVTALTGCGPHKGASVGGARDILIFTPYRKAVEQELALGLQKEIFTPQPASEFFLRYTNFEDLEPRLAYHSLFFIGLEHDPWVSEIFPNEVSAQDSSAMFRIRDVWAKDQLIIVLVATDSATLIQGLKARRQEIYEAFKYHMLARLEAMTYMGRKDRELTSKVAEYGFGLKVPTDWLLVTKDAPGSFIWIHTHNPDRSVFVYWEDAPRPELNPEIAMDIRDSVTALYYEGDVLNRQFTTAGPIYFRGIPAVKIAGIWDNEQVIPGGGGGPMITYAFNTDDRFYLIDGMLYYPESTPRKKLFWLNQLEVILSTFNPDSQG